MACIATSHIIMYHVDKIVYNSLFMIIIINTLSLSSYDIYHSFLNLMNKQPLFTPSFLFEEFGLTREEFEQNEFEQDSNEAFMK